MLFYQTLHTYKDTYKGCLSRTKTYSMGSVYEMYYTRTFNIVEIFSS